MRADKAAICGTFLGALLCASAAHADLFVLGSTFQVQGTNSPDTFTSNATLTSGLSSSLDGGVLNLTVSIVPDGSEEWLVFNYSTASGGPLSQANADWELDEVGLDAAGAVNLVATYSEWSDNGTVLTPTGPLSTLGYDVMSNPVPGSTGTGLGATGLAPFSAGALPSLGLSIVPFSDLTTVGIDAAAVNGYEQAMEFASAGGNGGSGAGLPEPGTLTILGTGLFAFGWLRRRRC